MELNIELIDFESKSILKRKLENRGFYEYPELIEYKKRYFIVRNILFNIKTVKYSEVAMIEINE